MSNNLNEEMRRATSFHKNGQLDQAEDIYKNVLINDPQQSDAQYLLGIISLNKGNYEVAIKLRDRIKKHNMSLDEELSETFI